MDNVDYAEVEEKHEAALADLALYKVEVVHLTNTIELLRDENKKLKTMIVRTLCEGASLPAKCSDAKKKLEFYHRMKHEVSVNLPPGVPWHVVKQYTDNMYEKEVIQGNMYVT
jgi:predicted RNase H-like nuclease (RuvC/YqgF family)